MSSHGQSGLSPWNVSSVVQQVILRAHRSLMIIRAYQPVTAELTSLRYRRIFLPLDGSQRAEMRLTLAESLARAHKQRNPGCSHCPAAGTASPDICFAGRLAAGQSIDGAESS